MTRRRRPRYLVERDGRAYWQPSGALRAAGFALRRLDPAAGDVWQQAEALNRQVDLWRAGISIDPAKPAKGTVSWLAQRYLTSGELEELAAKTRTGYRSDAGILTRLIGGDRLDAITPPVCQAVKRALKPRGLHAANGIMRTARLIWSWGVREGLVAKNPWLGHRQFTVRARDQVWLAPQRERFKAEATAMGWPSLALALDLHVYTVQRPADVIRMARTHWQAGMLRIRQQKTGRVVHVPPPRPLREILEALPGGQVLFLLGEAGRAYTVDRLGRRVRTVLDALAAAEPDAGWALLQLRDMRRTGVVALAEAGCSVPEIASISGHDVEECERIVNTYLPRTVPLAKAAVRKWDRKLKGKPA
jgi:hypothetical protein